MHGQTVTAGFFGKVSSHGDFVSRRLPPDFLQPWDGWLQECMYRSREQLGTTWLEHYLTSPIWRFALDKGVLGAHAWAGLLMPSVDRVGRHFPLMIAAPAQAQSPMLEWLANGKAWYDELEELALSSLASDFVLDDFDLALTTMAALPAQADAGASDTGTGASRCLPIGSLDRLSAEMPALTTAIAKNLLEGHSLWWTDGSPLIQASLLVCPGLPAPASFAAMLDGSWKRSGWRLP